MNWKPENFLDPTATAHWELFADCEHVWDALPKIKAYLKENLEPVVEAEYLGAPLHSYVEEENVYIGKGTVIEPGAVIKGPAWIGENCQIRPGAYIRGNVIAGNGCVLGNSSEFKNCVLFDGAAVPHFNYVGDSILGAKSHLGAGVICSNLKLQGDEVVIRYDDETIPSGLRKFGAILGDHAEAGCNAVLNPGTVLGRYSLVYPGCQWRGLLPEKQIGKSPQEIFPRRDL